MINDMSRAKWGNRFILSAIIQGGLLTSIALLMVGSQFIYSNKIDMIQFLSLSFDGPAKWFFLGIIIYLIFIVAIAVTAVFYIQLEINLAKKISGFVNIFTLDPPVGDEYWRSSSNNTHDFCWTGRFWNFVCIYRRKYRSGEYRNNEFLHYTHSNFNWNLECGGYSWWNNLHKDIFLW